MGKSRLVSELKRETRDTDELMWLEGRSLELGMTATYWAYVDIFRQYFMWKPEDSESVRAERVASALKEMTDRGDLTEERVEEMGPLLGNLLSVRFGTEWGSRLKHAGPEQVRYQTFMCTGDFLLACTKRQPLVLVFEDLHWADSLSMPITYPPRIRPRSCFTPCMMTVFASDRADPHLRVNLSSMIDMHSGKYGVQ